MMDFWTIQLQFSIAVMSVLILRIFMKKIPKVYSYLLWIFVFLRLLCPFTFEMNYAIMPKAEVITEVDYENQASQRNIKFNGGTIVFIGEKQGETLVQDHAEENVLNISIDQLEIAGKSTWFLGTLLLLVYNLSALLVLLEKIKSAVQLENQIYVTDRIETPFAIGLIKPRIYIPKSLCVEEREYIIYHEKIHIKRKDYLIKNIAFLLTSVYWFNPLCWVAFRFLELDMEMSCDEAVVKQMGSDIKKQYSQSLLNFAAGQRNGAFTPLTFGEVGVKERIKNILKNQSTKKWMTVLGIIILLFVGILVFTTKKTEPEIIGSKKEDQVFVESWVEAFVARNTEYILQHTNERVKGQYETAGLLLDNEDGTYDFGWSSPWPWGMEYYEISEIAGNQATIYYTGLISDPHVIVWRDVITFQKQEDGEYLVTDSRFDAYEQIDSLDEFLKAYPDGVINGTPVDYLANDLGIVLNRNAKENTEIEDYQKLFSVETAVRHLLNLSEDEDSIKISIISGESSEKECTVRIIFAEDECSIDVKMMKPYGTDGIWIPQTAEEILEFVRKDHNILNEVSFELPRELSIDDYNANVGFEGGCLFLPMAYEGDDFTEASWKSSGMISRYTQNQILQWSDNQIEHVANYYNHTLKEIVERVDGLCAPALLLKYNHDLYTAADLAALQEQGVDIASLETTSDYWYLFIAEPGEEYGYVITLTQKNYTREDILNVGKSFKILK